MELLGSYKNGNYNVSIYDDGTKIRETEDDFFVSEFPENIDIKITNQCDIGCPMCHENSYENGKHGDIMNAKFIDTLRPFTELAIGGGNALAHPDLIPFLTKLKSKNIIANLTINQIHFMRNQKMIKELVDRGLIYGLGVSLGVANRTFIKTIKQYPNAVIHVINGIVTYSQMEQLADNGLKVLILGYKEFRRGESYKREANAYIEANQINLKVRLRSYIPRFEVISFDNLAIEQLNVKDLMSEEEWNQFYMGDDGQFTMYVDMVTETFAKNSIAALNKRYRLLNSIDEMFKRVKEDS